MDVQGDIDAMERALAERALTVRALCDLAEVNPSTWTRWKAGLTAPNMATWIRVRNAFAALTPSTSDAA